MGQTSRSGTIRHRGLAKLSRPRLAEVVHRERLVRRCDALSSCVCTWITAPAGYGKTTHLVDYLDTKDVPCLWYQVDEADADLATFFSYLGMAVEPYTGNAPSLLTPEYFGDIPTFARRWFRGVFERIEPPFAFVFDNAQLVGRDAAFHDVLRIAIAECPQGLRIFVASRERPSPPLIKPTISGEIAIIDIEALSLTDEEAIEIASMRSRKDFTEDEVRQLNACAQGWVAGLVLLLPQLEGSGPTCRVTEMLFDYFAGEVVRRTDEQKRALLCTTALLPEMTVSMVRGLTDIDEPESLLEDLSRHNFFTYRSTDAEPVYQFHALFREFLLEYARQTHSGEDWRRTQRQAAKVLADAGRYSAAVELLKELKHWETLAELIGQQAEGLAKQGRHQTLQGWLQDIPEDFLEQAPWLLFWSGYSKLFFEPADARSRFQSAYKVFKDHGDPEGSCLSWAAVVDTYWLELRDFRPLHDWFAEFEQLRPLYQSLRAPEIEARMVIGIFSSLLVVQPDHPEFTAWEQRALRLIEEDLSPDLRLRAADILVYYYVAFVGRRGHAKRVLDVVRSIVNHPEVAPANLCALLAYESAYYYFFFEGSEERCLATQETALATAREHGVHLYDVTLHLFSTYVHLSAGRCEDGRESLSRALKALDFRRGHEVGHYDYLRAWEAWLSGRLPEAVEHMSSAMRHAQITDLRTLGLAYLGLAQIQASRGDRAAALRCLAGMRQWARRMASKVASYLRALKLAQFALEDGKRSRCLKCLRSALKWAREEGYFLAIYFKPEAVAVLCAEALRAGIETDYVKALIEKRELKPPLDHSGTLEEWPWRVKVYTLGQFSVWLHETELTFPRKAQQKPLELLKLLIAFGGRGVALSRLADNLWPESEGDAAQRSLATTLHRLRRLLGSDQVLALQNARLTLDTRQCWVDAWAFEQAVRGTGEEMQRTANPELAARQCSMVAEHILQLYRGPFLGEEAGIPQVVAARERLRSRFLHCLRSLGTALEQSGRLREAIRYYEGALETEAVAEELYLGLMRCYAALGRHSEAIATYRRCEKILAVHLGTAPSTETRRLYEVLKKNIKL